MPASKTEDGIRAMNRSDVVEPDAVQRYLASKFGDDLELVRSAMQRVTKSFGPKELATAAFSLYEQFRPEIPDGVKGWGAKGVLDLVIIKGLVKKT